MALRSSFSITLTNGSEIFLSDYRQYTSSGTDSLSVSQHALYMQLNLQVYNEDYVDGGYVNFSVGSWSVSGRVGTPGTSLRFTLPTPPDPGYEPVDFGPTSLPIVVEYGVVKHEIIGTVSAGGSLSPSVGSEFFENEPVEFSVSVDPGYELVSASINGVDKTAELLAGSVTVIGPTADLPVTVVFASTAALHLSATGPGAAFVTWSGGTDGQPLTSGTSYSIGAALSSPLYRISSMTLDGSPSANPAAFVGDSNDHTVVAVTETETRTIYTSLTLLDDGSCPAGMRTAALGRSGTLIVQGSGDQDIITAVAPIGQNSITMTGSTTVAATDTSVNVGAGGSWVGQRLASLTVNGLPATFAGVSSADGNLGGWYSPADLTPGVDDVTVAAVITVDRLCMPDTVTPPPAEDGGNHDCPPGTVWSGTACVAINNGSGGGSDCEPGYYWDAVLRRCVKIEEGEEEDETKKANIYVVATLDGSPYVIPAYINGVSVGNTPVSKLGVKAGTYWVNVRDGTYADNTSVTVAEGGSATASFAFTTGSTPYDPKTGKIQVLAFVEFMPFHMTARINGGNIGQTEVTSGDLNLGTYAVSVYDAATGFSGSKSAQVLENTTTQVRFDFFNTDGATTNGLRVMAIYGDSYLVVPFTLTDPSSATSDQVTPYASADGIATGTWSASTTWRGSTITATGIVATTGVTTLLLVLPGWGTTTLGEEDLLPKDLPDVFQVRWRDEYGPWSPWLKIDLGKQGADEPFRWLSPMGIYRHRQYEFMATGPSPLVVPWIEEDVEPLGS